MDAVAANSGGDRTWWVKDRCAGKGMGRGSEREKSRGLHGTCRHVNAAATSSGWRAFSRTHRIHALMPSCTKLTMTGAKEVDWAGSTRQATVAGKAQVLLSFSLISVF